MEDLGHYLANYSAAQCMQWGLLQGCGYVKTRCGAGGADRAAVVDAMDECEGRPVWLAIDDPLLAAKCAGGIAPCATVALNGYQSADGVKKCNAQCYTGATPITGAPACTVKPAAAVEGAETSEFMGREISAHWMQYLWIAVWVLGAIFVLGCARVFLCPKEGSKLFMNLTSTIMITAGLALFVVSLIGYLNLAVPYISMVAIEVEALMGVVMLYVIGIVGGVIMLVGLTTLLGICCKSACLLIVMQMFWIVLLLAQVALAVFLFYWVQALDDVSADTLSNLQGVGDGVHEGKLGADALKEAEGFMCRSYQRCCRDPALDAPAHAETGSGEVNMAAAGNRTCLASHAGTSSDVAAAFDDPSTPSFCEYISGSSETVALKPNTCDAVNTFYSLETCRANFCLLGAEGYFEFVQSLLALAREYATWLGAGFAVLVLFQIILMANLRNLRKRFAREKKAKTQVAPQGGYGYQGKKVEYKAQTKGGRKK